MKPVSFFLGANSGEGFYSLYDQLLSGRFDDLMILKGGPGCGKSTFMRRMGAAVERTGERVAYIHCSGDPDSLDGAVFLDRRAAIVDGTSPHVLEPTYAVACERRTALHAQMDFAKLRRRVDAILARELRADGQGSGRVDRAFLGGLTHRGDICCFDTAEALCPRIYALSDSAGLGAQALRAVCEAAAEKRFDVLACPDPDRPRELQHVLIPERGLAFITTNARIPYEGKPCRRLRLDAMAEGALTRTQKTKLRFARRVEASLREEAVSALASAKRAHDALENAYHPCVDFDGVTALADEEIARLLKE